MPRNIEFSCDECELIYSTHENSGVDLPPYWLAVHIAMSNEDGLVSPTEEYIYFCSPKCLCDYTKRPIIEQQLSVIDQTFDQEQSDDDSDNQGPNDSDDDETKEEDYGSV